MFKNSNINLKQIKKIISEKGFVLRKKKSLFNIKEQKISFKSIKKIISEKGFVIKEDLNLNKKTVENKSKSNFQKVLDGKSLDEDLDTQLDTKNLFQDIFSFDEIPNDTVRLSASTVKELFKDTKYDLDKIRKTKLVKPIKLSLLPNEIREIESTKEKKKLFLEIILPLILEENNRIKFDRIKLFSILNKNNNTNSEVKWLN